MDSLLKNFSIVLSHPRFPENIGAAARAAFNMGLGGLVVVAPEDPDEERMLKMAPHTAAHLIRGMKVYPDLKDAVADFSYIVGTSARSGRGRRSVLSPREVAPLLIEKAAHNKIALVFGPEDKGLSNAEISLCHQLVKIPTADFSSLNLAQAVMVVCYEIFSAEFKPKEKYIPRLAGSHDLELMYKKVKDILIKISFIHPSTRPLEMNILRFASRVGLGKNEVKLIMGICLSEWYGKSCAQNQGKMLRRKEDSRPKREQMKKKTRTRQRA
jgi:tRNA/rRNA methyltransferase